VPTKRPREKAAPAVVEHPGQVMRTTGTQTVALTFDDGPDPRYTPRLLAMLRQHGVKATFCVIGVNVHSHPELIQAIVRDGHSLCNHTWQHDLRLGTRSREAIAADLQRTNAEIHRAVPGVPIRYFRHPGGNFTPAAVQVAADLGMASVGWTVDPSDWNTPAYGGGMTGHIISNVEAQTGPGGIVLSHDGGGDRGATMNAYQTLLPWLAARFTLVRLPD
jgi:peptidoglycan/xylan/chitin deacetylase (PgdA/CDA1 family)